MQKSKVKFDAL